MRPEDAAPLDIFAEVSRQPIALQPLLRGTATATDAEISEAHAATFVLGIYRQQQRRMAARLRNRRLSDGSLGKWMLCHAARLGISAVAAKKIRGVFRRRPGKVIYDIYLNDPDLQQTYRLALLPAGQANFVTWLTTHGRVHKSLTDSQILWFLYESAETVGHGLALTYLLRPDWQREFPVALTKVGWKTFVRELRRHYGPRLIRPQRARLKRMPSLAPRGVNILSHFCNPSGIQQAALWTKAALERAGFGTSCRDVPVPRYVVPPDREDWLGLEVYPVTILTHAAEPYFESGYERAGLLPRENVYRIAYWAWELENVPDEWVNAAERVDEIWAPTRFVAEAMRARMSKPVHHLLPGVEIGPLEAVSRASIGVPEDHFVFLFMFDFHSQVHRKNPVALFRAFQKAFRKADRATLLIKATGGDIHSADLAKLRETIRGPNVILLDRMMTRAQAYGLIAMSDCFVSLHRSEGFGLGLAEGMLLAKPVIGTAYSGNMDFMNADNSLLVDYEMVQITEDRPIYTRGNRWAEPSIEHAATLMREVFENPAKARARAERAQPEIQRLLSLEAAGERMRRRLEQIRN